MLERELSVIPSPIESIVILFTLAAIFAASCMMFWALVTRWTSRRQWVTFSEWGREHGFSFCRSEKGLPPPLEILSAGQPLARICLTDGKTTILQFQADAPAAMSTNEDVAAREAMPLSPSRASSAPVLWNVLIRKVEGTWRPTGLRPTGPALSVLDLFSLSSFPLMGAQERFVIFGTDSATARRLSASPIRALLPPDIGVLLHGSRLVLDFSNRPFDAVEFSRVIVLADQIASRLPISAE